MSTPLDQQQQPPPLEVTEQAYSTDSGHGSVGPVIAVLAVLTIVGVIAGMIGRLCTGGRIFGHGDYDFEGWVQSKCSSCLDGRVDPAPTQLAEIPVAVAAAAVGGHQEAKEEEQEQEREREREQEQEEEAEQTQHKPHESSSQS